MYESNEQPSRLMEACNCEVVFLVYFCIWCHVFFSSWSPLLFWFYYWLLLCYSLNPKDTMKSTFSSIFVMFFEYFLVICILFLPSGYHSQRLNGQISVQRLVWLDCPAHKSCTAQQERYRGIYPSKRQWLTHTQHKTVKRALYFIKC